MTKNMPSRPTSHMHRASLGLHMPTLGAWGPKEQRQDTWYRGASVINAQAVGVLDTQEGDVTRLGVQWPF